MIPSEVKNAAKDLIMMFGSQFALLGQRDGRDVYRFLLPEDEELGFPSLFLFDRETKDVKIISGHDALQMIDSFGSE